MNINVKTNILIIGSTGMLGSTLIRYFCSQKDFNVLGTFRDISKLNKFSSKEKKSMYLLQDLFNKDSLENLLKSFKPDLVINCVGIIKQVVKKENSAEIIKINSMLPHLLFNICSNQKIRFLQISTDCVFSGKRGGYKEDDIPEATDLYGKSKYLGEINEDGALTIRTSIIGHEICTSNSLLEWFLKQENYIMGYKLAYFSGFPTVEIAKIIKDFILPNKFLKGTYHVSSNPINKFDLLKLISEIYEKDINIVEDYSVKIDRTLNCKRFMDETGFKTNDWQKLIKNMYLFK